jgi:acetolactate synthase-1/2/3 large subunit
MLNNRSLGMVRQLQDVYSESRYAESYMESLPDFDKLAASFGHVGFTVERPEEVEPALRTAFAMKDKLVFMNFITDRSESVWPMIEAGKGLNEMMLSREDI